MRTPLTKRIAILFLIFVVILVCMFIVHVYMKEKDVSIDIEDEAAKVRDADEGFRLITFEDQTMEGFEGRAGSETLTVTDEENHTDDCKYALKTEGRTSTWHGPSLRVEKYVDEGTEYRVSVWVKLIEPENSQIQLSTQIGEGTSANYVNLAQKTISTWDGWIQLEGAYRYNNVSSKYLTIYVESSDNAEASFYIDDISFESTGSKIEKIQSELMPVKQSYEDEFLIGTAISSEDLAGIRFDLLTTHFNSVTAGNAMKSGELQRTKGNFTFSGADNLVDTSLDAGMKVHGHTLVWHQQSPEWMNTAIDTDGNMRYLSREEALDNMRTHIKTVVEHFADKVISWDVVNEAMSDNSTNPSDWKASLRKSPWYYSVGEDYIEQAFLAAREVLDEHPEATLVVQNTADWSGDKALQLVENWIQTYPDGIDVIAAQADCILVGVITAVEDAGLAGKILLGGMDCDMPVMEKIKEGVVDNSIWQDGLGQGAHALRLAIEAAQGNEVSDYMIPYEVCTPENVDMYIEMAKERDQISNKYF